ncbi:MAG: phosphoethanolamine transferase, partial [Rickettsiaceae bacterium]|nr:phosphoethanolamine transferase [Rickettsiaceae bacterium]
MIQFNKAVIIATIYTILFNIPSLIFTYSGWGYLIPLKLFAVYVTTIGFFALLLLQKHLAYFFITLFFSIGGAINYYIFAFGKSFDNGVLVDLLSVETDLICEYISAVMIASIIISGAIGFLLTYKIKTTKEFSRKQAIISIFLFLLMIIPPICSPAAAKDFKIILRSLEPFNIFYAIGSYFKEYLPHLEKSKNKTDLTDSHKFQLTKSKDKPLYIVLIIGESMRGDIVSLNGYHVQNMPLLTKRKNLTSFTNAKSSGTLTRVCLPYMLTSAKAPDFNRALSEKSVISIFKNLGFATSWIGNQGLFGAYDAAYGSIALEADYVIDQHRMKDLTGRTKTYDGDMLEFLDKRIEETKEQNNFIVIHMLGSHWTFSSRYPEEFPAPFSPVCKSSPESCSKEELWNAYFNSIVYSDYFLNELIKRFEDKNAFILFSSDHGISLGENGIIGNGYQ